jgi:hypothetical protein
MLSKNPTSSSVSKFVVREDFPSFITILVALEKRLKMFFRVSASVLEPVLKISISSTKRRCVTWREGEILIPEKDPVRFSSESALLSPSATRRKSSGESGQPCLKPLSERKKGEVDPFISTEKETVVIQHIIHLTKETENPK